jgi:hypothetical protein
VQQKVLGQNAAQNERKLPPRAALFAHLKQRFQRLARSHTNNSFLTFQHTAYPDSFRT